jgi:alkylation response protein AidB-like acyl-CoA dehydrogenase
MIIALDSDLDFSSIRRFVLNSVLPLANEKARSDGSSMGLFSELHRMGWLQAAVPAEYGGSGLGTLDLAVLSRELAYGSCGVMLSAMVNLLCQTVIGLYASDALKQKIFLEVLADFSLWSFCVTEPGAGSDVAALETRAVQTPGGYRITGTKCFITNGNFSKHLVVLAKTGESLSAFYVEGDSTGLSRGKPLLKLGQNESNTTEIFFDDVFVPETHLLGSIGDGMKILARCISRSKTMIAAAGIGAATRAFELVSAFLQQRVHYGRPLAQLPVIRGQLAQLMTEVEAAWLMTCRAAAVWDSGRPSVKEASMAKLFSADVTYKAVGEMLELFGGYGYSSEYEIERIFRDVRALEIFEGSSFVQQAIISKELFKTTAGEETSKLERKIA